MARPLWVGDSLGVGTSPFVPHARANVRVGARARTASRLRTLLASAPSRVAVFDLGTNDPDGHSLVQAAKLARKHGTKLVTVDPEGRRTPPARTR